MTLTGKKSFKRSIDSKMSVCTMRIRCGRDIGRDEAEKLEIFKNKER